VLRIGVVVVRFYSVEAVEARQAVGSRKKSVKKIVMQTDKGVSGRREMT